jgi:hypothetical protein
VKRAEVHQIFTKPAYSQKITFFWGLNGYDQLGLAWATQDGQIRIAQLEHKITSQRQKIQRL